MRRFLLAGIAALTAAVAPTWAAAQDLGGINNSWSSTQMLLNAEKDAWAAPECVDAARWSVDCKDAPPPKGARADSAEPALDASHYAFRPSLERRRRNFSQFVQLSRAADPAGAAQLEAFLAQDVIGFVAKEVAPLGLTTDNLVDAATIYVSEAWEAANAKPLAPSPARAQAVRRQMLRAIAGMPIFAAADEATKQQLAEAMLVQAVMNSNAIKLAIQKGDAAEIAAVQAAARQGARSTLGLDLGALTMTEAGLREGRS